MSKYLVKRKVVVIFAVVVMMATMVPYLVGYVAEGGDWVFTGFVFGVEDGNSYIAKMLSGAAGAWLFESPYSAETQRGVVAFLPYILLGKLTAPPAQHEQLVAIYHGFRFFAGILAIFASYDFLGIFIKKESHRLWALMLTTLGGGVGWLLAVLEQKHFLGSLPLEFLSPESFGFLALLGLPHLAAARALLLWGFYRYEEFSDGLSAGILWLLMGFFQPLALIVAWAVVGCHTAVLLVLPYIKSWKTEAILRNNSKQLLGTSLRGILISSPLVIYMAFILKTDAYFQQWSQQNVLPAPHWLHYLIAYGMVLPFSVLGTIRLFRERPRAGLLLATWMTLFPVLINLPVGTQRRLAEGIWVVLVSGMGFFFASQEKVPLAAKALSVLLLPTSFLLLGGSTAAAFVPTRPIFIPAQEAAAFLELRETAAVNDVILTSYQTGNNLPAWAPVRVVFGHGPETVNSESWEQFVSGAFSETTGNRACEVLLEGLKIDFLIWGPAERSSWNWDPWAQDCLRIEYNSNEYVIFRVE